MLELPVKFPGYSVRDPGAGSGYRYKWAGWAVRSESLSYHLSVE
jgi:hypothetical protein